jgi:hypothetical protein
MTGNQQEHGWIAALEDIMTVLLSEGFEEGKRETTTGRRHHQSAGGVWQGVEPRTGSVASAVWVLGRAGRMARVHRGR